MDGIDSGSLSTVAYGNQLPGMLAVPYGHEFEARKAQIGPWPVNLSKAAIVMSVQERDQLNALQLRWHDEFVRGTQNNLALERLGVHTVLCRADYFLDPQGGIKLCEFDDRPAGLGVLETMNVVASNAISHAIRSWEEKLQKPLAICISEDRNGTSDDLVWAAKRDIKVFHGMPSAGVQEQYAWWPRISRHEETYYPMTPHALSTIELEGDKSYGVRMGLWHKIGDADIPLEEGCALKPAAGSRFETIQLVKAGRNGPGFITLTKARRLLSEGVFAYWQPLFNPENSEQHPWLKPEYQLIRRVYYALILRKDGTEENGGSGFHCVGGCWLATPNSRIHGTKEALTGPIYPPQPYTWQR